jgi:hypothetical protein
MKKIAVIILVACITILVFSACNKKACPAYSKANTEQSGSNG